MRIVKVVLGMILCILSSMITVCIAAVSQWSALLFLVSAILAYLAPIVKGKWSIVFLTIPSVLLAIAFFNPYVLFLP